MNSLLSMLDVCHVGSLYFFIDSGSIAVMKNMQENAGNESAIDDWNDEVGQQFILDIDVYISAYMNYYVHIRISKYIYTVYVFQIMNIFFWPKFAKSRRWRGDLKFILSYRWHGASLIMTMNAQEILFSTCWLFLPKNNRFVPGCFCQLHIGCYPTTLSLCSLPVVFSKLITFEPLCS